MQKYLQGVGSHLIDDMWDQNTFDLKINFFAPRRVEQEASYRLCNEYSKGMQASLSDAARDVVFESFKTKEFALRFVDEEAMNVSLLHNFKLMIGNMPKSILSLKTHIANLRGIALRSLFTHHAFSRKVVVMKESLRVLLVECLEMLVDGSNAPIRIRVSVSGRYGYVNSAF